MSTQLCLIPKFREPLGSPKTHVRNSLLSAFSVPPERIACWVPQPPCLQRLLKEWRRQAQCEIDLPTSFLPQDPREQPVRISLKLVQD